MPPQIKHITNLIPHSVLTSLPPSLSSQFTIYPGACSENGKTEKKFAVFRDGTMLELAASAEDSISNETSHTVPNGTTDLVLTFSGQGERDMNEEVDAVRKALRELGAPVRYAPSWAGQGSSPSSDELLYKSTSSSRTQDNNSPTSNQTPRLPNWQRSSPSQESHISAPSKRSTTHPSGATGLKEIVIGVPRPNISSFVRLYQAMTGQTRERIFTIATPAGGPVDLILQPFDEASSRIVAIKLWTRKNGVETLHEMFGSENGVRLEFVPQGAEMPARL